MACLACWQTWIDCRTTEIYKVRVRVLFLDFLLDLFGYFFGFRAPGGKKARQEATARKDRKDRKDRKEGRRKEGGKEGRKEGRKQVRREGRKEGRKEGTVFLFKFALETLAATVLFAKP